MQVDTLFVVSTSRGDYALNDLLAAIKWSCNGSHYTVLVDETSTMDLSNKVVAELGRFELLHSGLPIGTPTGFHRAAGLLWAIEQGIAYRQVIFLSDTCLILAKGLDQFFQVQLQQANSAIIGVRDRDSHLAAWRLVQGKLFEWGAQQESLMAAPISLCDDVLFLAGPFIGYLYERNLLVPGAPHEWQGTYGSYVSWVAHLAGFNVISWGHNDKVLPPLYVNHVQGQYLVPPHVLSNQFLVYSPVNRVMSYSEADLRELFKSQRGENALPVTPWQPIMTMLSQSRAEPAE